MRIDFYGLLSKNVTAGMSVVYDVSEKTVSFRAML